jgi:rod shape-determining protein MreD
MNHFLYITVALCLLVCQTTLVPHLPFVGHFYDLQLPLVIYMAAFRPLQETLPFVLFVGALVDNLSGGPFGLYLTSYLWLFLAVRLVAAVVRAENPLVMVPIIIAGVLGQNAVFVAVLSASGDGVPLSAKALGAVSEQIGWVLLTGPFLAVGMRRVNRLQARRAQAGDRGSKAPVED